MVMVDCGIKIDVDCFLSVVKMVIEDSGKIIRLVGGVMFRVIWKVWLI